MTQPEGQRKYFNPSRETDQRRTGRPNSYVVANMWERHHEIARLILLGWSNKEIGERIGITPEHVSNVRNSPIVMDKIAIMRGARDADSVDLAKEIRDKAPVALDLLYEIISGEQKDASVNLRARTAENWIDRAGFVKPTKIYSENIHGHYTVEDIERIKQRAMGDAVDAEFEEVKDV